MGGIIVEQGSRGQIWHGSESDGHVIPTGANSVRIKLCGDLGSVCREGRGTKSQWTKTRGEVRADNGEAGGVQPMKGPYTKRGV